jgi:hypothetical protein
LRDFDVADCVFGTIKDTWSVERNGSEPLLATKGLPLLEGFPNSVLNHPLQIDRFPGRSFRD